ncbi:MAG: class I tRNA ligase family protein [Christensenellales bacterium]
MGTLWNTYAFYVLYAEIDQFDPNEHTLEYEKLSLMDKWILSKLNTLIKTLTATLTDCMITEPARAMAEFTDDLRLVRAPVQGEILGKRDDGGQESAYMTLYTVLCTLAKLSALAHAVYGGGNLPEPCARG